MTNNSGDKRIKEQVGNLQVNFDKEAAWMRLQDRLESKDEKKPYFRMAWAAAAMLLAATTLLWYSLRDTKEVIVVKETPEFVTHVVKEQPPIEPRAEEVIVPNTQPMKTVNKHPAVVKKQVNTIETITDVTPLPELILVKEEPAPVHEQVKVAATPKPKMNTVHINEIAEEDRVEQQLLKTRYADNKRRNYFLKPAIEREDAERGSFGLFDPNKTIAN